MTTISPLAAGYVLLAVGSSPSCAAAARWAAAEALRRDAVLYAFHVLPITYGLDERTEAGCRVPARVRDWLAVATNLPVLVLRVTAGDVTQELSTYAREAAVVVVGAPDSAAHRELPRLLARACPGAVVVVDAEGRARHLASDDVGPATTGAPSVRDVMTSPAVTVQADDFLAMVVSRLDRHDVTSLPVVEGDGHLVGVIGEADVMRRLMRTSLYDDEMVRDAMSPAVWSVSPDEPLVQVADLFCRTSVKSLPVVLHDRVVGVVSRRDLVRASARRQLRDTLVPASGAP
jgi:CBS domain-containing protein